MAQLMVRLDSGKTLPLAQCYWIQSAPCGCIVSLVTPVTDRRVLASPEDAHKHLVPRKRDRDKDIRDGMTWGLVTKTRYHGEIGTKWECGEHKKQAAS